MSIKFNSDSSINEVKYNGTSCNLVYYKPDSSTSTCVWAKPTTITYNVTNADYISSLTVNCTAKTGPDGTVGILFNKTSTSGSSKTIYYADQLSYSATPIDPTYGEWYPDPESIMAPTIPGAWQDYDTIWISNPNSHSEDTLISASYYSNTSATTTLGTIGPQSTLMATINHPVIPGTVRLSGNGELVDDGSGSFVEVTTGSPRSYVTGTINYNSGKIVLTRTDIFAVTPTITATYRYVNDDDYDALDQEGDLEGQTDMEITCKQNGWFHKYYFIAASTRAKYTYSVTGGLYSGTSGPSSSLTTGTEAVTASFTGTQTRTWESQEITSTPIYFMSLQELDVGSRTNGGLNYAIFQNYNLVPMTVYYCWGSNSNIDNYSSITVPARDSSGTLSEVTVLNPNDTDTVIYTYGYYDGSYTTPKSATVPGNVFVTITGSASSFYQSKTQKYMCLESFTITNNGTSDITITYVSGSYNCNGSKSKTISTGSSGTISWSNFASNTPITYSTTTNTATFTYTSDGTSKTLDCTYTHTFMGPF